MTSAQQQLIRALYQAALERPPGERAAFVAARTAGDPELRESVERLLSQSEPTGAGTAADDADAPELAPGTTLGHYRIDAVLGRGGMGLVYRATDLRLNRSVAVKFLSAQLADAQARRRFAQEAETASGLNHPHIVTVLDVGEHAGRQYIVSELVDGGTLHDWWSAGRDRGWRQSVELLTGVADALAAAHAAGVLHRDVKPGNILLGSNGYAKLADFGLAKLAEDPDGSPPSRLMTRPGVVVGTVAYMSPEQAGGRPLDARSDIFSFGIVLYEALAGRRPFEADNDLELLKTIVHGTAPPLSPDVPEQLRNVVERALEKDPADRYQAMRELVIELKRIVRKSASAAQSGSVAAAVTAPPKGRAWPWVALGLAITVAALLAPSVMRALRTPPSAAGEPAASASQREFEYLQVTTSGNAASGAAISPDGRYVVYTEDGATGTSLWLRQVGTPSSVRLVDAPPPGRLGFPTVAPDMRSVDFIRSGDGAHPRLWRVPFLGGTARPFIDDVWSPVGWSPDGQRMAFVRVDPVTNDSALVVADPEGGAQRVLATRRAPRIFLSLFVLGNRMRPAWSPDGTVIALYDFGVDFRLVLLDAETGEETIVDTKAGNMPQGLAWLSPRELVLNQPELGSTRVQLSRMSYPEGVVVPLSNDASSLIGADLDASRQTLATSRREQRMGVWLLETDSTTRSLVPPALYSGLTAFATPAWFGNRILFPTTAAGRPALNIVPADGSTAEELVANALQGDIGEDGTMVFTRGVDGLWVTDTSGRRPERLVAENAVDPLVLPDRSVLYVSGASNVQTIWRVSLDGGEPAQVDAAYASVASMDVSRDGRRLLFGSVRDGAGVLVICDLPSCTNRSERPVSLMRPRWGPDGQSFEYLDTTRRSIWSVPLEGGTPRQVTAFSNGTIASFRRSPDGQRLAILLSNSTEDVVLLQGLR